MLYIDIVNDIDIDIDVIVGETRESPLHVFMYLCIDVY